MSYTYRIPGGGEVVCSNLTELKQLVAEFSKNAPPAATPQLPEENEPERPSRAGKKERAGDFAYLRNGYRIVNLLLTADLSVGMLTTTLAQKVGVNGAMLRKLVDRLLEEDPPFIRLSGASRGVAPYVKVSDRERAAKFALEKEQEYREKEGL